MDIKEIKIIAIKLRRVLLNHNIHPDVIILFGSYAKKNPRKDSDIDLAVISRDYGKNRFVEGSQLNYLVSRIDSRVEALPIGLKEYLSPHSISPILHEIVKYGVPLF